MKAVYRSFCNKFAKKIVVYIGEKLGIRIKIKEEQRFLYIDLFKNSLIAAKNRLENLKSDFFAQAAILKQVRNLVHWKLSFVRF